MILPIAIFAVGIAGSVPRQLAGQHGDENDAAGPEIRRASVKFAAEKNLRRHVWQSPAAFGQLALGVFVAEHRGHAEIGQFQIVSVVEENVFRFQIAMSDAFSE